MTHSAVSARVCGCGRDVLVGDRAQFVRGHHARLADRALAVLYWRSVCGAPIHLVQAALGHASVATTGRYLHARPTDSSSRYLAV
jgi:integrase